MLGLIGAIRYHSDAAEAVDGARDARGSGFIDVPGVHDQCRQISPVANVKRIEGEWQPCVESAWTTMREEDNEENRIRRDGQWWRSKQSYPSQLLTNFASHELIEVMRKGTCTVHDKFIHLEHEYAFNLKDHFTLHFCKSCCELSSVYVHVNSIEVSNWGQFTSRACLDEFHSLYWPQEARRG